VKKPAQFWVKINKLILSIKLFFDIPQVSCRLTGKSPDFPAEQALFPQRRLLPRKRLEMGGSGREHATMPPRLLEEDRTT
jgi:hypothetical protein